MTSLMALQKPIIFLRGFSGEGKDTLNFGPLPLPLSMFKPWCDFFRSQGLDVLPIEGLGGGSLNSQVGRAENFIKNFSDQLEGGFHLVGHSGGGLVAWGVASKYPKPDKVLSLTTLATPHNGAALAELFVKKFKSQSLQFKVLNRLGYDIHSRLEMFQDITPTGIKAFKAEHPLNPSLSVASYCFSATPQEMTWPVRIAYGLGMKSIGCESDGFVELTSQTDGKSLGHYPLDHLSQIGYHFYLNPRTKAQKLKLFEEVGSGLIKHLEQVEQNR